MKLTSKRFLDYINQLHNNNLYIPDRLIYFGAIDTSLEDAPDEVNSLTSAQVIKNLYLLEQINHNQITLILNSIGGSWDDGIAIYDYIKSLKSKVKIVVLGKAWSMGSIILQAGSHRIIYKHTSLLIHDGSEAYAGTSKDFEAWAKRSLITREQMYKIYYEQVKKKRKKITLQQIEDMCNHDFILTGKEIIDIGLADKIIK